MSKVSTNQTNENTRTPFEIKLEEHLPFNNMASTMFISSNDLAKAAADLFRSVFADFEGIIFEIPQNNQIPPYFSLVFNHGEYDENATTACTRAGGNKPGQGADILTRIRYREAQVSTGDRFLLNEDGKDVVQSLLLGRLFNNGNPNWKNIVSDYTEGNQGMYGYRTPQYTKVSFIDPNRLCSLLFGDEFEGDHVDYQASIFTPISSVQGQTAYNYMLSVIRVSAKEVGNVYEKLGLASMSRIIR